MDEDSDQANATIKLKGKRGRKPKKDEELPKKRGRKPKDKNKCLEKAEEVNEQNQGSADVVEYDSINGSKRHKSSEHSKSNSNEQNGKSQNLKVSLPIVIEMQKDEDEQQ